MFGWLWSRPRCPIDTWEKTWTETRMRWLARSLGIDRLHRAVVVLPNDHYFPDPYRGTAADVRRMMDRLCGYMQIDPTAIALKVTPDSRMPNAAGLYQRRPQRERSIVRIAESQLSDPPALAATLAHELAHEILLGGGLLDASVPEHELVADLVPVYLGVGVFAANDTVREWYESTAHNHFWSISQRGYLPSRMFGYALALFAFMRGEYDPDWIAHLRLDAASACRNSLRYLRQTDDSLFHPDSIDTWTTPGANEILDRLRTGTPSTRLAALWDLQEQNLTTAECLEAVTVSLQDNDSAVAAEAAHALPAFGAAARPSLSRLREALWADAVNVRVEAAHALGELRLEPDVTVPELSALLKEKDRSVLVAAAWALGQFGVRGDAIAVGRLLDGLHRALVECDGEALMPVAAALHAVTDDLARCVREHFVEDAELRRQALAALAEHAPPQP